MDLNFLKALLSSQPTAADDDNNQISYPQSPADPMKNQSSILDSMLSPKGAQPLYDYSSSPQSNMTNGSPLAQQVPLQPNQMAPDRAPANDAAPANEASPAPTMPQQASPQPPSPPMPEAMPAQPMPPVPTEDPTMKMLSQAQDNRKNQNMLANMLDAGDRIGTAIAGQGNLTYEKGKYDNLRKIGDQGVEDVLEKQKMKGTLQDQELRGYNIQKAKQQATDDKAKSDPNSDISRMNRASVVDSLNRIGRKDLASQVKPNMSSKQIEDLFGEYNLQNMVTAYDAQQNRLEMAKVKAGDKTAAAQAKMDQKDTERLDKFNKAITSSIASSRGAFGKMANIKRSAEAIEQLSLQNSNGNMDNRQIQELARSLDSMLSQGAATITGSSHLVPRSASGDASKLMEYIGNIPRGAGQQAFVKKMLDTVEREKALATNQIKKESKALLGSGKDLADRHPEAWGMMLKQHGLPEDIFSDDNTDSHPQFNVDQGALSAEMKKRGL